MIVCPPIAIVYIDSYHAINMIHATYIWVLMLLIVGVFIKCKNGLNTKLGAFIILTSKIDFEHLIHFHLEG
jgi:hypothetical protein